MDKELITYSELYGEYRGRLATLQKLVAVYNKANTSRQAMSNVASFLEEECGALEELYRRLTEDRKRLTS